LNVTYKIRLVAKGAKTPGNPRLRDVLFLLIFAVFAVLQGCGVYSFSGSLPRHIKTIAIPLFEDRTSEFGIREDLTDALITEFTNDNTLTVEDDPRRADSVLRGTILRVEDRAGQFDREERVHEIRVYVTVRVKFEDRVKRKTLWEGTVSQWGAYDPDTQGPEGRNEAIKEAIQKLAEDVLNKVVASW